MNKHQWEWYDLKWQTYWVMRGTWTTISNHLFGGCERCGKLWGVKPESSRTAYHVEGIDGREDTPVDPNRNVRLCRTCADDHHQHWDSMWSDYYSGLL